MSKIKDIKLTDFKLLIPKTLTDVLHYLLGLTVFLGMLHIVHSGIALLITAVVLIFKELNDQFGWVKWLLTDGKNKTGFSGRDFWMGFWIPLLITIIL